MTVVMMLVANSGERQSFLGDLCINQGQFNCNDQKHNSIEIKIHTFTSLHLR